MCPPSCRVHPRLTHRSWVMHPIWRSVYVRRFAELHTLLFVLADLWYRRRVLQRGWDGVACGCSSALPSGILFPLLGLGAPHSPQDLCPHGWDVHPKCWTPSVLGTVPAHPPPTGMRWVELGIAQIIPVRLENQDRGISEKRRCMVG